MKLILTSCFLFLITFAQAQIDSAGTVEPNRETSFSNNEVWLMALAALGVLLAVYFLYRRRKSRR